MEKPFLVLAAVLAAVILGGVAAYLLEQLRTVRLRADRASLRADAQGRCLGMIARELEVPGLSLLGLAARLPPALAGEVEAEARRLLALSEEVADNLLGQPAVRGLAENRIPLGPLLHEVVENVSRLMGAGARHWLITPEAEALVLLADRRALRRALSQSLSRAARETRTGDRIVLRVVRAAETVALVIEDEGAGLPRDDLSGLGQPRLGHPLPGQARLGSPRMGRAREGRARVDEAGWADPGLSYPGLGEPGLDDPGRDASEKRHSRQGHAGTGEPGLAKLGPGEAGLAELGLAGLRLAELGPAELGLGDGTRGLSLGLAAARELIRAHGGELTLEAVPGIGTRTWLTLPRGRVLEDRMEG